MEFSEEDWLQLSGLQHFAFCRRQWALIHIENQWAENYRTVDGQLMHEHVHDPMSRESRGDRLTVKGLAVHSTELGISGQCDAVEFYRDSTGVPLRDREGLWLPYPVEYKRGKPKEHSADELQLCAQAMCLEEMLGCEIRKGCLFYGEIRRRIEVPLGEEIRKQVKEAFREMHQYYERKHTPMVKRTKACNACSLKDLCLPQLMKGKSAREYISRRVKEEDEN